MTYRQLLIYLLDNKNLDLDKKVKLRLADADHATYYYEPDFVGIDHSMSSVMLTFEVGNDEIGFEED